MINRYAMKYVEAALNRQAAVALLGPRQVGKTTLAHAVADSVPSIYLDLESPEDKEKLSDPVGFLSLHQDKLVILDEIHRVPEIFQPLRGIIDQGRRSGKGRGRFLILGSASIDLLHQSSETLAGRIEHVDLGPLNILETNSDSSTVNSLWLRGGFPDSFLSKDDTDSFHFRRSFIRSYLDRDVAMFGPRIPSETLNRLWTMLAHSQGSLLNASKLAGNLSLSAPTVSRYIELLVDLLLVRRLAPYHSNNGKRLVKSPKTYVRDSGLVHTLLGIETLDDLLGHPVCGSSWEGFVIENLIAAAPLHAKPYFYRTSKGAEIDLLLDLGGKNGLWAIEIKRGRTPKLSKGFDIASEDLRPTRRFVVYSGEERYSKGNSVEAISLADLALELTHLRNRVIG